MILSPGAKDKQNNKKGELQGPYFKGNEEPRLNYAQLNKREGPIWRCPLSN